MIQSVTRCFCVFLFLAWPLTIPLYAQKEISLDVLTPNTNSSPSPVPKSTAYELSVTTQVVQNANCNQNGIISAQAKDGLPPYEYQIVKAIPPGSSPIPPPPPTPSGTWVTSNIFNVEEGTYLIIVRDQMGMEASTTQTITKDSVPKVQFALENSCVPEGTFEIVLEATNPGIPPYFLSSNGSVFEPISLPHTLYNQNSGDYNMIIKDSNGCENRQTILIHAPLVLSIKACTPPSCLSNNGIIELVANRGSSNLEYSLNGGLPTANPIFSNLSSGQYTARVEDKITGCFDEIEVDVTSATAVTGLKLIPTAVKCNGGNDGTIKAILDPSSLGINDNPMYTYSIDNIHFQESNVFSGLAAGGYTVKVISGRGCVATDTIIITEPNAISITAPKVVPFGCSTTNNLNYAIISAGESSGGSGTYTQYEFVKNNNRVQFGSMPMYIESDLSGGVYTIKVSDTNGCSATSTDVTLNPFVSLEKIKITTLSSISCRSPETIQVSAETKGGIPINLEYSLVDIDLETGITGTTYPLQINTTGIFSGLSKGNYSINVLNQDTGCRLQEIYSVKNPNTFDLTIDSIVGVSCHGGNNSTAQLIFIDKNSATTVAAFNYEIRNQLDTIVQQNSISGIVPVSLGNLTAGIYSVKATLSNTPFCSSTKIFSISEPEPLVATLILKTPLRCDVQPLVELNVSGGTAQYTYGKDGTIYSNTLFDTSQQLAVGIGTYSFFVKDANGCVSKSNTVVIDSIPGLKVEVDEALAKINCKGDATATLTATAFGALGTYRYSLLDEVGTSIRPVQSSGIFTLLAAGKYKIMVESGDCTPEVSRLITITEPAEKLSATFSVIDVLCAGATNGKIQITLVGGTAEKMVAISPNLSQFVTTTLFDNLASGSYDVLVKDALGCFEKKTVTIQEPLALAIHTISSSIVQERCFDDKNAQFSIAISGGIKPYAVSLDRPTGPFEKGIATQTQFDFTNLSGGSHIVYIKDANNCYFEWNVILNESVKINSTTIVNYDCVSNAQHNLVTVNLETSSTDFNLVQFALDGGIFQSSNLFSNLSPGDHFIRVKHNNGCNKDSPIFTIENIEPLTLTLKEGGLNEIIAVANGGGGNYKYAFNGEINGTNPSYGYSKTQDILATVADANGCYTSVSQKFNFIDICTPNYFTPNGDGINDTWEPGCTQNFKNLTFLLFDRYGRELGNFHFGESWNGKYQGIELPSGDYWYVLKLNAATDDREFVGHFTLYR